MTMNINFNDLESIVFVEERFNLSIHANIPAYRLEINSDGSIRSIDYDTKKTDYYVADKSKVEKLYNDIITFIQEIKNEEIMIDDTDRKVTLEYHHFNIEVGYYAYNAKKKHLSDILDQFMKQDTKPVEEKE